MAKANGKPKEPPPALDIAVEFGGVSIGKETARLGVKIDREVLNIVAADEIFCGHRLTGRVVLGRKEDAGGQMTLVDDLDHQVTGAFDVNRIGVNPDVIATGLTFALGSVDVAELAKFSKGAGRLIVNEVGEIPEDAPDEDHDDEDSGLLDEAPGTLKADGPWRDTPMADLFSGAVLKALKKAGITTVGKLADFTAAKGEWWWRDIPGVGESKAQAIEDRMMQYWAANPQAKEEAGELQPA